MVNNYVALQYGFETFIVEEREETLVYDIGSFLAAGIIFIINNLLLLVFLSVSHKMIVVSGSQYILQLSIAICGANIPEKFRPRNIKTDN